MQTSPETILRSETAPGWTELALANLDQVLLDHAHCEKKAAAQAMSLLATYPDRVRLVQRMARLAQEELAHFRQVYDRLLERGLKLPRDHGDPYARRLRKLVRHDQEDTRYVDLLLVAGLIEARSCERLTLLSAGLAQAGESLDPSGDLTRFYASLAQAERGHARLFVELAAEAIGAEAAESRLTELAEQEARITAELPLEPRIH